MLADLFAEIENSDFAANMRILSGMTMVLRMLEEEDSLLRLVESVKALPATKQAVVDRLFDLLSRNNEPDYLHPYDAALTGYLYVLNAVDQKIALRLALGLSKNHQLWWTRRLAEYILSNFHNNANITWKSESMPRVVFRSSSPFKAVCLHQFSVSERAFHINSALLRDVSEAADYSSNMSGTRERVLSCAEGNSIFLKRGV